MKKLKKKNVSRLDGTNGTYILNNTKVKYD